jgi:hypothetical protein
MSFQENRKFLEFIFLMSQKDFIFKIILIQIKKKKKNLAFL